jgi:hypothetical protein
VGKLLLGGLTEVALDQRLVREDGGTMWVTVTLSIQWDAGGRIQSLIGKTLTAASGRNWN